jgi:tetratricopeptide (TPR) repeat protein
MSIPYALKQLGHRDLGAALEMALHYRDLNQPEEAESICRDILDVDPVHEEALTTLGLALTDRFPTAWQHAFEEAITTFNKLPNEYDRIYYEGVAWERLAKAHLEHGQAHNAAHAFEEALLRFAHAERLAPAGRPEPILRWNRCVRALLAHAELALALTTPRESGEFEYND